MMTPSVVVHDVGAERVLLWAAAAAAGATSAHLAAPRTLSVGPLLQCEIHRRVVRWPNNEQASRVGVRQRHHESTARETPDRVGVRAHDHPGTTRPGDPLSTDGVQAAPAEDAHRSRGATTTCHQ